MDLRVELIHIAHSNILREGSAACGPNGNLSTGWNSSASKSEADTCRR